jgi:GTP-binding protein
VTLPLVAIVGAPNVGKSTLFNRLVGRRTAIVTDEPGVTRDRLYGEVRDSSRPFRLVDTGGLTPNTAAPFAREIAEQADAAMGEAALILFVVDARAGATAVDFEVAELLRRRAVPILLVANKIDVPEVEELIHGLYELGLGDPSPVSAEHGLGVAELLERIAAELQAPATGEPESPEAPPPLNVAIVGRPNVGKSTLFNRLAGEERVLVSDIPGTTRDAVDTLLTVHERSYRLIDTAGIRRRGRVQRRAERFSVARARANIDRCDVAVLVLDAAAGFAAQDAHIAGYVQDAFKPLVVAVNKWDLIEGREDEAKRWKERVEERLRFLKRVPMLLISAKTGQRAMRVLEQAEALYAAGGRRIGTSELNRWLQDVAGPQLQAPSRGHSLRLFYATQTGVHPPHILIFCNNPQLVHFSFRRYLDNSLRERFDFAGSPLRLSFRARRERE